MPQPIESNNGIEQKIRCITPPTSTNDGIPVSIIENRRPSLKKVTSTPHVVVGDHYESGDYDDQTPRVIPE